MTIGSTVYSWSYSRKIKNDMSFHKPKDCQYDFLNWPLYLGHFLYQRVIVFPFHGLFFWLRLIVANPCWLSCLNFWDKAWRFLSLRVFRLLSSSWLLFLQLFGRYVLQPSSGVCQTQEPTQNFKLRPLLNPWGVTCSDSVSYNQVQVLSIPVLLLACNQDWTCNLQMIVSLEA